MLGTTVTVATLWLGDRKICLCVWFKGTPPKKMGVLRWFAFKKNRTLQKDTPRFPEHDSLRLRFYPPNPRPALEKKEGAPAKRPFATQKKDIRKLHAPPSKYVATTDWQGKISEPPDVCRTICETTKYLD